MNNFILKSVVLIIFFITVSCNKEFSKQITHKEDYKGYLIENENISLKNIKKDIDFWQKKYDASPNQYTYLTQLSALYSQSFEITGKISELYHSEKLLLESNLKVKGEKAGIHRSLAKNYISQHRFKEALFHLNIAKDLGENRLGTQKMLFDVHMELGNYTLAKENLDLINNNKDFDYLIRVAKWNDHLGDLDTAIAMMEKAKDIAEESKNENLKLWLYSNIADYYGHAGRIQESYDYYLKTLELDHNNTYALKGIAWIAFSYERDANKALEIIDYITKHHNVPDLYLFKADIYEYLQDNRNKKMALNTYQSLLKKEDYGDMYNKYNALLYSDSEERIDSAIALAEKEVVNRPTSESYDLLAWAYYNNAQIGKAFEIIEKYTIDKSHEPLILFHNELILKANNKLTKENSKKADLLGSIYELGPNFENSIKNL